MNATLLDPQAAGALLYAALFVILLFRPRFRRGPMPRRGSTRRDYGPLRAVGAGSDPLRLGRVPAPHRRQVRLASRDLLGGAVWVVLSLAMLGVAGLFASSRAEAASYSSTISGDSPLVWYRLGESSGSTALDNSGHGYSGTYASSGIAYGATGAISGDADTAITNAGSSPAVTRSDTFLPSGSSARSMEVWLKASSNSGWTDLMSYGTLSSNEYFDLALDDTTTLCACNEGVYAEFTAPYSLADGNWHLIDETYGGGTTVEMYVDGQSLGSGTLSSAANTVVGSGDQGLDIGGGTDPAFQGSVDEAAIYSSHLTAASVMSHWTAGVGAPGCPAAPSSGYQQTVYNDSPVRYWELHETSGSAAVDYSGNCSYGSYAGGVSHGAGAFSGVDAVQSASTPGVMMSAAPSSLPTGSTHRTIELWEKSATNPTSWVDLASYGTASTGEYFEIALDSPTAICQCNSGVYHTFTAPYSLTDGHWHMIDDVYDGGTGVTMYVDGQRIGTATLSQTLNTVTGNMFEVGSGVDGAYTGSMDDVSVYSSALTAAKINAHWSDAVGGSCPALPTGTSYAGTVAADSPTRFLRMGESGAYALDYSGSTNCRNAAYGAGVSQTSPGPVANDSGVDGVSNATTPGTLLSASDDGLPSGADARTMELWMKTSTAPGSYVDLASYGGTGADGNYFSVELDGSATICACNHNIYQTFSAPHSLTDGTWHMIDYTYDGGTGVGMYVDGNLIGTATLSSALSTALGAQQPFEIGSGTDGAFTGSIGDVAVFPTALSRAAIARHYMASGNTPAPIGGALTASQVDGCSTSTPGAPHAGDPVDTESGNFREPQTDLEISGRGCPLKIERTYQSQNAGVDGPLGYGWSVDLGMSLAVSGSSPNQVATITEEGGSVVTFNQPASGSSWPPSAPRFIATLTHNGGGTWTFVRDAKDTYTFNSSGQITSAANLNGYTDTYAYSGGKLSTITDEAGRSLSFSWTGTHITSVTDANVTPNRTVSYSYDGSGNLTDVTDVNGGDIHFTYDGSHRITVMKDPVCEALGSGCPGVQNHYDGSGRIDWQKDQLNRETTFAYAGTPATVDGGSTIVTDPAGNEVQDVYQWGLRIASTSGYGTADAATTHMVYDPATLALLGTIDATGGITQYTLDSSGNVLTSTDPLGRVTTRTYNSFNEPLTIEDPNGVTTTMTYDANGNLLTTSTPVSGGSCTCAVTTNHYGDVSHPGDVTSVDDPNGKTTHFLYDSDGNPIQVKDPLGHVTGSTYNADGWITASWTPLAGCTWNSAPPAGCSSSFKTTYSYAIPGGGGTVDGFGDVQTVTDPLSHTTTYGYDANRNKTSVEDANSHTTSYTYDMANEMTTTTRPDSTTMVAEYNDDRTVKDQKDGKGNKITSYGYSHRAQVMSVKDALNNETDYTYDANGNQLTKQDPSGNCGTSTKCTTMAYDADNELKTVAYSDGVTPDITATTYDADGQRTATTDGTGSSSWAYDQLHRITSYTNGNGDTVTYGYSSDLKNQVHTIAYPNSVGTVTQTWNDDGTLASAEDWNSKTTTFGYDTNANLTSIAVPSTTSVTDTFGYNAADQMASVSDSNGSVLFSASYTRGGDGQLTSDNSQASNQGSYKYTSLNQLCYAGSGTSNACTSPPPSSYPYGFDAADNLTTIENAGHTATNAQQFNAADELCWILPSGSSGNACGTVPSGGTTVSYDDRGNLTSEVPSTGSATCNSYDQADRLTEIHTGTGSSCTSPATVATYAYDGDGMRESKTVSGTTTHFTWGGSELLQEKTGSTKTSYLYGPGGLPFEQIAGSTTTYLHHDQVGSTRLVTDSAGATGTATTITYDPYGNVASTSGSLTTNLKFQGQYRDDESGLYYLRARYYDPSTAQFLSRDPMVATTRSPYAYVAGNPLNMTDPSGLCGLWGSDTCLQDVANGWVTDLSQDCLRNPFGGENDNGGCHSTLTTAQGGIGLAIVGIVATGGALAAPEAAGAGGLGVAGLGASGTATAADIGPCMHGDQAACMAAAAGAAGLGYGGGGILVGGDLGLFLGLSGAGWSALAAIVDVAKGCL